MQITFLRHATMILSYGGRKLLIDPMFGGAESMDPIRNTPNQRRNPLVDLPFDPREMAQLLEKLDAIFVTHTHQDHWDQIARESLAKSLPLFCQPEDLSGFADARFDNLQPVERDLTWQEIHITRTGGQHGSGELGEQMGPVSGFLLQAEGEPSVYVVGDSIWCREVEDVLRVHQPDVVIVNAGAAQFLTGDPITMAADDVLRVLRALPASRVVAVHMEAINHCLLKRAQLQEFIHQADSAYTLDIPQDGAAINIE